MSRPLGRRARALAPAFVVTVTVALAACGDEETPGSGPGGASLTAGGSAGSSVAAGAAGTAGNGGTGGNGAAGVASGGGTAGIAGASPKGGAGGDAGAAGNAAAGSPTAGGATGVGGADGCPAAHPRQGDPCVGELECEYPGSSCTDVMACRKGAWKLTAATGGFCNPPGICPDEEPLDAEGGACDQGNGYGGPAMCRFPRNGCFSYLECGTPGQEPRWRASTIGSQSCDTCCPLAKPAIGTTCAPEQAGLLCGTREESVVCRDGLWSERSAPFNGSSGGSGGQGGSPSGGGSGGAPAGGGAGFGGTMGPAGSGGMGPGCPAERPLSNDPCVGDASCGYNEHGCGVQAACQNGRWAITWPAADGVCDPPAPCPETEPAVPDTQACTAGASTPARSECRYPHATCFRYLICIESAGASPRWGAPFASRAADDCCPAAQPAVGSACDDEGALCRWAPICGAEAELTCRQGTWQARLP